VVKDSRQSTPHAYDENISGVIDAIENCAQLAGAAQPPARTPNLHGVLEALEDLRSCIANSGGGGLNYRGVANFTGAAPADPQDGDLYVNSTAGTVDASWSGISGETVTEGAIAIYGNKAWALAGNTDVGGGVQSVAMCLLAAQRRLPRPDHIVFADTGREVQSTHLYRDIVLAPYLASHDMAVEIAPHSLATVDVYAHNGDMLMPAHTATGQMKTFCSGEWKARVSARYLRSTYGYKSGDTLTWIGFSLDERRRIKSHDGRIYPLAALGLRRSDCIRIIQAAGLPVPRKSRCWCCPHQTLAEWRELPPEELAAAAALDNDIREQDIADGHDGLWLHRSRVPVLDAISQRDTDPQTSFLDCTSGLCFV